MEKNTNKKIYSKSEARYYLPSLVDRLKESPSPIYITDRGVMKAVLVDYEDYTTLKNKTISKKSKKYSDSGCFGMWADREDMKDSVEWVNKLREKELRRSYA